MSFRWCEYALHKLPPLTCRECAFLAVFTRFFAHFRVVIPANPLCGKGCGAVLCAHFWLKITAFLLLTRL
ncbi:hypothetical protein B1I83_08155 [Salmonella enterica subsp. enterica serovar Muenchen]|nr:hypothetical protein [Salmonella enterica subsp. enterica serovar Muenchen]